LLRLLRYSPHTALLADGFYAALPALSHVAVVLFLCLYLWGVLGVQMFGFGGRSGGDVEESPGLGYAASSFTNWGQAAVVLLRISLGGSWSGLMHDCSAIAGGGLSPLFFLSFVFCVRLVLLALTSTALVDGMRVAERVRESFLPCKPRDLAAYKAAWGWYDTTGTGYIPTSRLPGLIGALSAPLGVRPRHSGEDQYSAGGIDIALAKAVAAIPNFGIRELTLEDIPAAALESDLIRFSGRERESFVQFHDVLEALTRAAQGKRGPARVIEGQRLVLRGDSMRRLIWCLDILASPSSPCLGACVDRWKYRSNSQPAALSMGEQVRILELDAAASLYDQS